MTAITYTAKRSLVDAGFEVSGTDISASTADDSFNSTIQDFSGLLAGYWVLITNSVSNDGWHQLSVDSTATKITTTSNLVDELAGANINVAGYIHALNATYTLETAAHSLDKSFVAQTNVAESLSGIVETLLLNNSEYWSIKTDHISEAELPYWNEFFSSVRGGESFDIDPYGTVAAPVAPFACIFDGNNVSIDRVGSSRIYTISFKVRQL